MRGSQPHRQDASACSFSESGERRAVSGERRAVSGDPDRPQRAKRQTNVCGGARPVARTRAAMTRRNVVSVQRATPDAWVVYSGSAGARNTTAAEIIVETKIPAPSQTAAQKKE